MYKHIMVPVDGSELSVKAVTEAVALAKALGSKLTLMTTVSPFRSRVTSPFAAEAVHDLEKGFDDEHKKQAQKLHDELAGRVRSEAVPCESLVVMGDSPYAKIIEQAEASKCDLILMASHGRRGFDALVLGSETVKVLTHTKIPVLVVR